MWQVTAKPVRRDARAEARTSLFIDGRKPIRATFDFIDTNLYEARLHPGIFNAVYPLRHPAVGELIWRFVRRHASAQTCRSRRRSSRCW